MDYEKEYKEMVQRARELHESGNALTKQQMEIVCPALAESDDERLRKKCIELIKRVIPSGNNQSSESKDILDCIAYLEKQKEQKPISFNEPYNPDDYEVVMKGNATSLKQKEQKPVDRFTLENPLTGEKVCEREIPEFMKGPDPKDVEAIIHLTVKGWTVIAPGKEQKPTNSEKPKEWSEEDKTNGWRGVDLKRYLSCLQRLGTGNPQQPETINSKWFKEHCRPQLKREDWTEEDSIAIKEIQNALEVYMIKHGISEKQRKKLARWLDIHFNAYPLPAKLYPHWKPSEEQMDALFSVLPVIRGGGGKVGDILQTLYDDLKKLL